MARYEVMSSFRKAENRDWIGISGNPGDTEVWHYIRDNSEYDEFWDDGEIAPSPYRDECQATCDLLNKLNDRLTGKE